MNKIIIKMQRLDADFDHDRVVEWELKNADELFSFRRIKIPHDGYIRAQVRINLPNGFSRVLITSPMRVGEAVFRNIQEMVFSEFVNRIFE